MTGTDWQDLAAHARELMGRIGPLTEDERKLVGMMATPAERRAAERWRGPTAAEQREARRKKERRAKQKVQRRAKAVLMRKRRAAGGRR